MGTIIVRAAARAAFTSGVGEGIELGVAEVGVELETLVGAVVSPQPTKASTAPVAIKTPR
jgi:hypothetical protein